MTALASSVTLAASHLFFAFGRGVAEGGGLSGSGRMAAAVRGSGVSSYTVTISAIRLRLDFSPLDRRVLSLPEAFCACARVGSRSASGRITTPLASHESTSRSFSSGAVRSRCA